MKNAFQTKAHVSLNRRLATLGALARWDDRRSRSQNEAGGRQEEGAGNGDGFAVHRFLSDARLRCGLSSWFLLERNAERRLDVVASMTLETKGLDYLASIVELSRILIIRLSMNGARCLGFSPVDTRHRRKLRY